MKYFWTVLITAILVGGGSYIYFKGIPKFSSINPQQVSTQSAAMPEETSAPVPTPTPSGSTVSAGGILSMSAYTIFVPSDWDSSKSGSIAAQNDLLTVSKDGYKISISQGAFGGGGCLYPGDPDQAMAQRFNSFIALTDASGDNMRLGVLSAGGMVLCQKNTNAWGDITSFGHVSVSTPKTTTPDMVSEIVSILSTLTKI